MIDIKKPTVEATHDGRGNISFLVIDREVISGLTGDYSGSLSVGNRPFYVHLDQPRGSLSFSGWGVSMAQYGPVLSQNAEMWEISGTVNMQTATVSGSIRRMSGKGNYVGKYNFSGKIAQGITIDLLPKNGTLSLSKSNVELSKPKFWGGQA